jgi:hypothetical protein
VNEQLIKVDAEQKARIYHTDDAVMIDFGLPLRWIGMSADQAFSFAESVMQHAVDLKVASLGIK